MGTPGNVVHVRLPKNSHDRLREFCAARFPGLQGSQVIRILLLDQLAKSDDELANIVLKSIQGKPTSTKGHVNRFGSNARGQRH